jgi:hypothetical protein
VVTPRNAIARVQVTFHDRSTWRASNYKSKTTTEIVEFDGPHLLPAIPGWQEVADYALDWALKHAESTG